MTKSYGDNVKPSRRLAAWCVHLFTASGAISSLFAIYEIHLGNFINAFIYMGIAILIDSVDGCLARAVNVREVTPTVDGTLLDSLVD